MIKNIEIEITESWEHYKDTLYEYVSEKPRTLIEILNQISGTKKDIDLAMHELTIEKRPICEYQGNYLVINTTKLRWIIVKKKLNELRELQEEINALKEMRFKE